MKLIIDAYAWIDYLEGRASAQIIDKLVLNKTELYTCSVNIAEVVSKVKRRGQDINDALKVILSLSKILSVDLELSINAAMVHAETKKKIKNFGLADAFVLATARKLKAKILTGDPHFKSFKETIMID